MLKKTSKGFTLIELSISIAFISILTITIAVLTVNLINSYRRGLTLKELNTVSTELIDDMRTAISNSSAKGISELCESVFSDNTEREKCEEDNAYSLIWFTNETEVSLKTGVSEEEPLGNVPVSGGFCSGTYSYLWNSGYLFDSESYTVSNDNKYKLSLIYTYNGEDNPKTFSDFRLLKILDPSRAVCIAAVTGGNSITSSTGGKYITNSGSQKGVIDISGFNPLSEEPTDLLPQRDGQNLALYNLHIDQPAQDSQGRNLLYDGSFILATVQGGINIQASGGYCATPDEYTSNFSYCAINKFNFAARATGE